MAAAGTPFDFIGADHFRPLLAPDAAKRLFERSVTMVEIETFSYCNRVCWFCPNATIDRRSSTQYMPERLYLRILEQLAEISYRGMISYSRYNEPLADRIILTRLAQAKAALPGALLHANSNGDYLTPAYLDELVEAGLRSLNIQIYLGNRDRYDHNRMRTRLEQIVEKLRLTATVTIDRPDEWLEASVEHATLRFRIYGRNFARNGCDRGGSIPSLAVERRTSPCLSPFYHVYVDYDGHVMPCCNLRSDVPEHRDAIIADLQQEDDLFAVYASNTMAAWRRGLIGFEQKGGHCGTCNFVTFDATPDNLAVHRRLQHEAAAVVV
jgi:MoaA/NifB/PqqE/SkfB family radical SAM enzyme